MSIPSLKNAEQVTAEPEVSAEAYEKVEIPAVDIHDFPWEAIWINAAKFEPGMVHLVPPITAKELREAIARKEEADLRLLRSTTHRRTAAQLQKSRGLNINNLPK